MDTESPDVTVLNVLVEDITGQPADIDDAQAWRDQYDLSFDVLADTDEEWAVSWGDPAGGNYVQHSYTVVNSDGTVAWHADGNSGSTTAAVIDAAEAAY